MKKHFLLLISFILLLFGEIRASEYSNNDFQIYLLDTLETKVSLKEYTYLYCDSSNSLTFDAIRKESFQQNFRQINQFPERLKVKQTYWGKICIKVHQENEFNGALFINEAREIDIQTSIDSVTQIYKTGLFCPVRYNDEIIKLSNIIGITIPKESCTKDSIYTVYFKFYNHRSRNVDPYLYNQINILKNTLIHKAQKSLFEGILLGLVLLMFFITVAVYAFNKQKLFLYYSFYLLVISFYFATGFFEEHHIRKDSIIYFDIATYMHAFFYILFMQNFVPLRRMLPGWNKYLNFLKVFWFVAIAHVVIQELILHNAYIYLKIREIYSLLIVVSLITLAVKLTTLKNILAKFLGIGSLCVNLGWGTGFLFELANIADDFTVARFGIIMELMVFSTALAYKLYAVNQERLAAKHTIINQLKENSELQNKVNRELELKVSLRTNELKEKNIELETQNEEIRAQRDNILKSSEILTLKNEKIQEQTVLLTQKNNEITDSIEYAERIQSALLPPSSYINEILPKYFILFKPKNIVSGDFYWIKKIDHRIIIIIADCTGHGVPGAFMSMLGISSLNEIISNRSILQPDLALNELRKHIKDVLRQTGKSNETREGIDISLCSIDTNSNQLQFAGAYNSAYIIRDEEIIKLKADRMPVGIHLKEQSSFTNHQIDLQSGDSIYLFSDGYPDQIGGKEHKRFLLKNFLNLLKDISPKSMTDQKSILEDTLSNWSNGNQQTDDILVMGIKI